PGPPGEITPVPVGARIRHRREELVQQIAMGGVNLNDVEPARSERRAASTNACTTPPISSMVSA
ncbi:MAG TPA: hypothetical protein VF241_10860, partial [Propionibacteriaceae bacterium]